jgi:hypothetical protein
MILAIESSVYLYYGESMLCTIMKHQLCDKISGLICMFYFILGRKLHTGHFNC